MKNKHLPPPAAIAVLTTITILSWVGFVIYQALTAEPDPIVPEKISAPLDASLNDEVLGAIKERVYLEDSQIIDAPQNQEEESTDEAEVVADDEQ